jgi:hypothetical protein
MQQLRAQHDLEQQRQAELARQQAEQRARDEQRQREATIAAENQRAAEANAQRLKDLKDRYTTWKRDRRNQYRGVFFDWDGFEAFATWMAALALALGCGLGALAVVSLFAPSAPAPWDGRAIAIAAVLVIGVYAATYWQLLRWDVYTLACLLGLGLAGAAWWSVPFTPNSMPAMFNLYEVGRMAPPAGQWWVPAQWFAWYWALSCGSVAAVILGLWGAGEPSIFDSKSGFSGFFIGLFAGAIFVGIPAAIVGFIISVSVTFLGWIGGGVGLGALTAFILYLIYLFSEGYVDAAFAFALLVPVTFGLVSWPIDSWMLGISAIYALVWGVALLTGLLIGCAVALVIHATFDRRNSEYPMPAEYNEVAGGHQ